MLSHCIAWMRFSVTHLPDILYLCGFHGSAGVLLVTASRSVFFSDGRYTTQARSEVEGARIVISSKLR